MSDKHLASIEGMMRTMKRLRKISIALAFSSLALSIAAILLVWWVVMTPTVVALLASLLLTLLLLWLSINPVLIHINYGITEISAGLVLGVIKDLDTDRLMQLVNEFSSFVTKFQESSIAEYFIVFLGFFSILFYTTALSLGSVSLGLFVTTSTFVLSASISIIIALGSHYGELIREVYLNPKYPQQLLNLIRSEELTKRSLFAMFIVPIVFILLFLPLVLPTTITREHPISIILPSLYFALASSELITAIQWLVSVLVGRSTTQLFRMATQLGTQGEGNRQ